MARQPRWPVPPGAGVRRARPARALAVAGAVWCVGAGAAGASAEGPTGRMPRVVPITDPLGFSELMIWLAEGFDCACAGVASSVASATAADRDASDDGTRWLLVAESMLKILRFVARSIAWTRALS